MEPLSLIALIVLLGIIGAFLFWWLIFATEGVYLGRRVVIWLYDVYASRYDDIKKYDEEWETITLAVPLLRRLRAVQHPLILDVATGTARLPLALLAEPKFAGHVIGLDYSRKMLTAAAHNIRFNWRQITLLHQHAQALPFDDNTFDAVTCLEALEFMPDPDVVIAELIRVAQPGAPILLSIRKGTEARLMPGKTMPPRDFATHLRDDFKLRDVELVVWQFTYDLVWCRKPGPPTHAPDCRLEAVLRCPQCSQHQWSVSESGAWHCSNCGCQILVGEDRVMEYGKAVHN